MDTKQRIEAAKERLRKAEQTKTIAETQKAAAEKQKDEIVAKMLEMGVTPETITAEIEKLEASIEADLQKIESMIPVV